MEGDFTVAAPVTGVRCGDIYVRRAVTRNELEQAYNLVYRTYRSEGYLERNPARLRVSIYNALPATITFVGKLGDEVVATVTVVPDTPAGLPMEVIYREEVESLRNGGRHLAEVTMLADRRHELRRSLPVVMALMKQVFDYCTLILSTTDLCITINPRHESYYHRYLLFDPLGDLKLYPSVRNNPALALRLDLQRAREKCDGNQRLFNRFFTDRTPLEVLRQGYYMDEEDLEYFFVEKRPIFRHASARSLEYLQSVYPHSNWEAWAPGK